MNGWLMGVILTVAFLVACDDPVVYRGVPVPEEIIGCDAVDYEGRSDKVFVFCRRNDGRVSLLWSEIETLAAYGDWTIDPPWGNDVAEITDSACDSRIGECAITTKRFAGSDAPGVIYAQWVDNPPTPWYEIIGTDFVGWTAVAASQGTHLPSPGWGDYFYPWVFGTENGQLYVAQPTPARDENWLIYAPGVHPCGGGGSIRGIHHSLDEENPLWLSFTNACADWSDKPAPEVWRLGGTHNLGWMRRRNVVYNPAQKRWLVATDTLYWSEDNGGTWNDVPRARFPGFKEPYFHYLVGRGDQLWAMGEKADKVWHSRNGGRSFVACDTWIPDGVAVSGMVFAVNRNSELELAIIIAFENQAHTLHVAAMWDQQ